MSLLDMFTGGDQSGFDQARRANERNRALYQGIDLPDYEEYVPEQYNSESADYQLTSDDPITKSAQLSYLNKLSGLSDIGLSDADQADFVKAQNQGNQIARSGNAAALNNAEARGVGGSGLEFLMREQAGQDGATRAQEAGLDVAANAAKQRALYNTAFGQEAGQVRDQNYRTEANNSNIINQFNQANTQQRNTTNAANVTGRNGAFQYNEGLKDKKYQNQIGQADRITGNNNRDAEIGAAQSAQRNSNNNALLNAGVNLGAAYLTGGASVAANAAAKKTGNQAGEPYDWSAYA